MATAWIKVANIAKNGLQTRVALNEDTVTEYTEAMDNGVDFPPVTVFREGQKYWLADGFHRVEAKTRTKRFGLTGFDIIKATIKEGGFYDALRFALGANNEHGLRRNNADKRRAVNIALQNCDHLFGGVPTAGLLAEVCAVSTEYASRMLRDYEELTHPVTAPQPATPSAPSAPPVRTRISKRGTAVSVPPVRRTVKEGYAIGTDGKEHAVGVKLDRFNVEIPSHLNAAFESVKALDEWAHDVNMVKNDIKGEQTAGANPVAASLQRAVMELENAYHEIKSARPFCVCRMCQGTGCSACSDTGYQTEDQYNRNPPEFKAV